MTNRTAILQGIGIGALLGGIAAFAWNLFAGYAPGEPILPVLFLGIAFIAFILSTREKK